MKNLKRHIFSNVSRITSRLNEPFRLAKDITVIDFAIVTSFVTTVGFFYLWIYLDEFGFNYFLAFFDIADALPVLYEKLMHVVLLSILMFPGTIAILLSIMHKNGYNFQVTKFIIVLIIIAVLLVLGILLHIYGLPKITIAALISLTAIFLFIIFFKNNFAGHILLVAFVFLCTYSMARSEASQIQTSRPRYDIVLKQHQETPILRNDDKHKFLIYKTANYYFIKDDSVNRIYAYSVSTSEMLSIKPYEKAAD
ncbi:hypothetical protein HP439_02870 [Sphingobacterium shayense]|uniref:hypothetical protein n=1 Tax=Sphingobacterium shayense TaxID=626343 RepID=UPI0015565497|nr:hypothetical protein [Sphingobacterium shayense]NQD69664.1 hypothetical protein [Sphingobacterium shayense]